MGIGSWLEEGRRTTILHNGGCHKASVMRLMGKFSKDLGPANQANFSIPSSRFPVNQFPFKASAKWCLHPSELEVDERDGLRGGGFVEDEGHDKEQGTLGVPGQGGELGPRPFVQLVRCVVGEESDGEGGDDPEVQVRTVGSERES